MSQQPPDKPKRTQAKRLSLWPLKPKDALATMLKTPTPGKKPRAKPEVKRKAR